MTTDPFSLIESDEIAGEFYLHSDIGSLYRWINALPPVITLGDLASTDASIGELLASRTLKLFQAPTAPGYRTEHEPALCCYAVILSRIGTSTARNVFDELAANAGPPYGWLVRILGKCESPGEPDPRSSAADSDLPPVAPEEAVRA